MLFLHFSFGDSGSAHPHFSRFVFLCLSASLLRRKNKIKLFGSQALATNVLVSFCAVSSSVARYYTVFPCTRTFAVHLLFILSFLPLGLLSLHMCVRLSWTYIRMRIWYRLIPSAFLCLYCIILDFHSLSECFIVLL